MHFKSVFMFLAMFAAPVAAATPLPAPHQVEIPEGSVTLHAELYRPAGDGPFPTVIALHGCAGLASRTEPVLPRYRDWAEQLLTTGHAVLLPDSYGSRELGPQCRAKEHQVQIRRQRVADINAVRQWLVQQKWVARKRISLVGWGSGAGALLWAVRPQLWSRTIDPDFRSAIAFYPDGRTSFGLGWSARVPTLVLIGGRDDVSSASACHQMVDGARGRSALARIVIYPEAYHGFDRANVPLRAIGVSSDAATIEHGHVGTDANARKDAQKRVAEWLAR
ncbi:dienelactone hydrolase family protein [Bradyrhizobium sp. ISRA443]|uniref:dienelactone hydrolase family protein n=1 Tax=unclassified Bradyrhizobium TaxID=2631580 RepID=UPI0024795EBE|nr:MULTISPECIES: dienelactone hydrolase family protein [unclassified Bradyrhizobium]WGS00529.1 dienelactone hydrolase family protein [Bradyrhizobium sp. ISRA436]WGS07418.1 dienelactone hydrolase family protein [Bradyrhizobium sp. ISRA437]WGS14304.1 dienelactone hydrolase family protein [Bradyrhizobium sp. ISRA443]